MKRQDKLSAILVTLSCIFFITFPAHSLTLEENLLIDQQLGILTRPWLINVIRMASRDYLHRQSRVPSGRPEYTRRLGTVSNAPGIINIPATVRSTPPQTTVEHRAPEKQHIQVYTPDSVFPPPEVVIVPKPMKPDPPTLNPGPTQTATEYKPPVQYFYFPTD